MFCQNNCMKMFKLLCLYSSQRSSLAKSLTLGYSHIWTRPSSSRTGNICSAAVPVFANLNFGRSGVSTLIRNQSVSVNPGVNEVQAEPGHGFKTSPNLLKIAKEAEALLGSEKFSLESSMSHNFGDFRDIITLFLFKVAHIEHPLLHLAKIVEAEPSQNLGGKGENPYILWRAMMVLLATEKIGYTKQMLMGSSEKQRIALDRHKRMAKIVEITHATQQIHKRIVDVSEVENSDGKQQLEKTKEERKSLENLHKANKAAALIGDLLWTQKCVHMAALNSQTATGLICRFLMEYCESEFFFGVSGVLPAQFTHDTWIQKSQLGIGSLMGNSLNIMILFSGHEDEGMRNRAYQLGSLMGLMHQAYEDIKYFQRNELTESTTWFWLDLGLLPVVYKIQSDPNILKLSHKEIFQKVKEDKSNMDRAKETFRGLRNETLRSLAALRPYESSVTAGDILKRYIETIDV